jgi:ATP phosphoribosyltransferase regulatory subunit
MDTGMNEETLTDSGRWLLPEGIEELLPPEAQRVEQLRRRLIDLYDGWGYDLVIPPFIEYLESLLTGVGHDLELKTFKLTDQLSGRLLGIRADMTPQVARIDARRLHSDLPTRLCYLGTVLHTRPGAAGETRSPLQVGAELYGHAGVESDVEVLCLMLETLRITGHDEAHVDLGHVGIFRGLSRRAGLSAEQEGILFEALQRKAGAEIEASLAGWALDPGDRAMLGRLAALNGGPGVLAEARAALADAGAEVEAALADLERIAGLLGQRMPGVPLYFDLAELRGYHYHTGPVFAAYLPGRGQAVAQGGRYDDIGRVFGRARPATGFSADLRALVSLLPEAREPAGGIYAPWTEDPAQASRVAELRAAGERVICALPGAEGTPGAHDCNRVLVLQGGSWTVTPVAS